MLGTRAILGLDDTHIVFFNNEVGLHKDALEAFQSLQRAGARAGFDIQIASAHRSFERQLHIWNAKAQGLRPVLDDEGRVLAVNSLAPSTLLHAILRWSALPGASRHHWGTDFDIYDRAALTENDTLALSVAETEPGGIFHPMYCWLSDYLQREPCLFRPFLHDRGGVAVEPWHLSYAPLSTILARNIDSAYLRNILRRSELCLKDLVLANLDEILARYVFNTCEPSKC